MTNQFTFHFQIYKQNIVLNDTNVFMYEFIAMGKNPVIINNQLRLVAGTELFRFKEDILENQKTVTQYTLKFADNDSPDNAVLVITKIPSGNWINK
jgi:hypothetical protein